MPKAGTAGVLSLLGKRGDSCPVPDGVLLLCLVEISFSTHPPRRLVCFSHRVHSGGLLCP